MLVSIVHIVPPTNSLNHIAMYILGVPVSKGFRNNERLKLAIGDNESGFRLVHVGEKGMFASGKQAGLLV